MSVLRIKAYHSTDGVRNGLDYSENPDKTNLTEEKIKGSYNAEQPFEKGMDLNTIRAFTYSTNSNKTNIGTDGHEDLLVSGIHCKPNLAAEAFADDMRNYYSLGHSENLKAKKAKRLLKVKYGHDGNMITEPDGSPKYFEDGTVYKDENGKCVYQEYLHQQEARTAYMWVQSFPPESVIGYKIDPRLAHQIGCEFVRKALDDYKCTVSTHMDRAHVHNHIMMCAYSEDGTHKYNDDMASLQRAREISDELSKQYGLPIILEPQTEKGMSWFEWTARNSGKSWKEQLRQDIRDAMQISKSYEDFKDIMEKSGYTLRETEHHITYTLPGDGHKCRDTMLNAGTDIGEDYTKDSIIKYFDKGIDKEHTESEKKKYEPTPEQKQREYIRSRDKVLKVSRYDNMGRRRSDLEMMLLKAINLVKRFMDLFSEKRPEKIPRLDNPVYRPAAWKLQQLTDTLQLIRSQGIDSMDDLDKRIHESGIKLSQYRKQREDLMASAELAKTALTRIDDMEDILTMIESIGLDIDDLYLYDYDKSEIRKHIAELSPMTNDQKRDLYVAVNDNPMYKLKYRLDEINRSEAAQAIAYLKGKSSVMPDVLMDISVPDMDVLKEKYKKIAEKRADGLKGKYGDKPVTQSQLKTLEEIFSFKRDDVNTERVSKYQGFEIDTDKISYYDAYRLINYLTDDKTFSSKEADEISRDAVIRQAEIHGDKLNRDYITIQDALEVNRYYKDPAKNKKPNILKDGPDGDKAMPSDIGKIQDLLSISDLKVTIPFDQMTSIDARNLYSYLLFHDNEPEILKDENVNLKKDTLFEEKIIGLTFDEQQAMLQARQALNELRLLDINVNNKDKKKKELENIVESEEAISTEYEGLKREYKTLSRIKYNLNLSENKKFVYGPLYDEEPETVQETDEKDTEKDQKKETQDLKKVDGYKDKDSYFEKTVDMDI